MKYRSICFFICVFSSICVYIFSYHYFTIQKEDPLYPGNSYEAASNTKNNRILPQTKLIIDSYNLKTNESHTTTTTMPAIFLGMNIHDLKQYLNDYMKNRSIKEYELGLVQYEISSYSSKEVHLKKIYAPKDHFNKYFIIHKNGRTTIYYCDHKTVYDYPELIMEELPQDIRSNLMSGMEIKDEEALYNFLENYSS